MKRASAPPLPPPNQTEGEGVVAKKNRRLRYGIVIAVGVAVVVFLFFTNPLESQLAPKCFWKLATGTDCPGCGFQRALHAFLHGNFADAARYNFFLILALPYLFAVILSDLVFRGERRERWQRFTHSRYMLWAYIIIYCVWWVVRNILGI